MSDLGHVLVTVGLALLLVPIAGMVGPFGFVLVGLVLVVIGAMVSFSSEKTAGTTRVNCPNCGSPNDPDADACDYCGEAL